MRKMDPNSMGLTPFLTKPSSIFNTDWPILPDFLLSSEVLNEVCNLGGTFSNPKIS